jgi:hypothetical protein
MLALFNGNNMTLRGELNQAHLDVPPRREDGAPLPPDLQRESARSM